VRSFLLFAALGLLMLAPAGNSVRAQTGTGAISGSIGFPSEAVPGMVIYAFSSDGSGNAYMIHTDTGTLAYAMTGVPPGIYTIVAYPDFLPSGTDIAGGYTAAVVCGLQSGCNNHMPVPVTVTAGSTVTGVDLTDWYAPNTFPPKP
jgi:hypothetical protein